MTLTYTKHERIWLRDHPQFNEAWLQQRIADEPGILGLGDLVLIERERRQERAGRLDLLMAEPDGKRRYEIELQLGVTDESHIIRCIEYWDIERRRYPGYDHCAVLVAEDVTTRFLSLLSLFAGTVPLIVIQFNALQIGDHLVLDFVRVLDQRSLRREDGIESKLGVADRAYWNDRAAPGTLKMADELLAIINRTASPQQQLNYNKYYVGLSDGTRSRNFVNFGPRKKFIHMWAEVDDMEAWVDRGEEAGLPAVVDGDNLRITLSPPDLKKHAEFLDELLGHAVAKHQR